MKTNKDHKESVTFRMSSKLRSFLEMIAEAERRSFSNQLNVALEDWVRIRNELHPQFLKDINDSLNSGKPESIWKG